MLEVDNMLLPPFTNSIALNLVPTDSDDARSTNPTWDPVEDNLDFQAPKKAVDRYQEALDLRSNESSPRLRAALLLHQGCISHLRAMDGGIGEQITLQHFAEAKSSLHI